MASGLQGGATRTERQIKMDRRRQREHVQGDMERKVNICRELHKQLADLARSKKD